MLKIENKITVSNGVLFQELTGDQSSSNKKVFKSADDSLKLILSTVDESMTQNRAHRHTGTITNVSNIF